MSDDLYDGGFRARHIGPDSDSVAHMLRTIGFERLDDLIDSAVPGTIRNTEPMSLPPAQSEQEVLAALRNLSERNQTRVQMIGQGYYDTVTPAVIRRRMLESPAWYTAYTPYQPEIAQGRLEALLTFQTLVEDLTALPLAGASLLDEATAVVEAMLLMRRANSANSADIVVVDQECFPQTISVLCGRAEVLGIEVIVADLSAGLPESIAAEPFGVVIQNPGSSGVVRDIGPVIAQAKERGALVTVAADLLSLTLLTPPGEQGADIAVGSAQRFGVPLFFGGPHAGFMSVRAGLERMLPGRLVGVSVDADGQPAYRLALQTREQHIRREKATSNICTAQALLANVAAMYAAFHGPDGLRRIASRAHRHAATLAATLSAAGHTVVHANFFDTITVRVDGRAAEFVARADKDGINLRLIDADHVGISCDECTTDEVVRRVAAAFGSPVVAGDEAIPIGLRRTSPYLQHPVFNSHHSETAMLRFLRKLSDKDLALDRTMIPLGSCTMKLNSAIEMEPISFPGFATIHPYAPAEQTAGYHALISDLERWLCEVTGYDRISLQPNAGSQGELAGLLAIHAYHESRGDHDRDIVLIPQSAHGTNAASAVLAGLKVVVVATAEDGNIDLDDVRAKLAAHKGRVAAIMITYPSTHGVYESEVGTVCDLVHSAGGQVFIDGANLNALVGLAKPGRFGSDVSHLNLHKTFCIPHGGGGPGVGPIGVRSHLAPFLPSHPLRPEAGPEVPVVGPVSGAPWGSAGILPIPYAYLRMMGPEGITRATGVAILSANYIAARLGEAYPILYTGSHDRVAHECILDLRPLTKSSGVSVDDVAKRLIDYGFHAPTMSFPVSGTLMVEPTESESLAELDRFCDAMLAIRAEIDKVESGEWPADDNPLHHAPHTAECLVEEWNHPYDRRTAAYPPGVQAAAKYWPPVRRIDGAYGDRNLVCSCPSPGELATATS